MGLKEKKRSGDYVSKGTKREVLEFIHYYSVHHDSYPTVDDIAMKMGRPRKVMAQFMSRYARFGIVEAFKEQGEKTKYGPGLNWEKIDNLEWRKFFRAGICPKCRRKGVLGIKCPTYIRYRCKWCHIEWRESLEWTKREILDDIERQAKRTEKQWSRT